MDSGMNEHANEFDAVQAVEGFRWRIIEAVNRNPRLSKTCIRVLIELAMQTNDGKKKKKEGDGGNHGAKMLGACYLTRETIAKRLGRRLQTVTDALKEAQELGLGVSRYIKDSGPEKYFFDWVGFMGLEGMPPRYVPEGWKFVGHGLREYEEGHNKKKAPEKFKGEGVPVVPTETDIPTQDEPVVIHPQQPSNHQQKEQTMNSDYEPGSDEGLEYEPGECKYQSPKSVEVKPAGVVHQSHDDFPSRYDKEAERLASHSGGD